MDVKFECQDLGFKYGKKDIFKNVSFTVNQGSFCAILGRNGSGKTTLLHCLNGVLKPDCGKIFIESMDITSMDQKQIAKHISLVPQEHIEIFPFKVIDVVVMGRAPFIGMTKSPGKHDYSCAMEALTILNANDLSQKNFNMISGGERQIVLLAMALVQASNIMLLDEPTNHLDFNNQYHLLSRIKNLCKTKGLSIIASMHDPNMATLFADQVIMLKNSRIITDGPTDKVMTKANINRLYDTDTTAIKIHGNKYFFLPDVATLAILKNSFKDSEKK